MNVSQAESEKIAKSIKKMRACSAAIEESRCAFEVAASAAQSALKSIETVMIQIETAKQAVEVYKDLEQKARALLEMDEDKY